MDDIYENNLLLGVQRSKTCNIMMVYAYLMMARTLFYFQEGILVLLSILLFFILILYLNVHEEYTMACTEMIIFSIIFHQIMNNPHNTIFFEKQTNWPLYERSCRQEVEAKIFKKTQYYHL